METSLDITTPAPKTTVGLKRMKMKKKLNLNTSKTKLKSVPATPVNFSFHNMSVQKQTLRANNKALAKNLAKVKLELRQAQSQNTELLSQNQEMQIELLRLRRTVGLKDSEIDNEVQLRIQVYMKEMKLLLEDVTRNMMTASGSLSTIYDKCITFCRRSTGSRPGSMCNDSALSVLNSSATNQRRTLLARRSSFSLPQPESLPKADEIASHAVSTVSSRLNPTEPHLDMSSIMEQSVLVEDTLEIAKKTLFTVSETADKPKSNSSEGAEISKLPKRVPKQMPKQAEVLTNDTNNSANKKDDTDEIKAPGNSDKVEKGRVTKVKSKNRPVITGKTDKNNSEKKKDNFIESCSVKNIVSNETCKNRTKNSSKEVNTDPNMVVLDSDSDKNSSSSGFGECIDNLVSGSPIIAPDDTRNRRETFVVSPRPDSETDKQIAEEETQKRQETSRVSILNASASGAVTNNLKTNKSAVVSKTADQCSKSKSKVDSKVNQTNAKKVARRETYTSSNPFKPKTTLKRTPAVSKMDETVLEKKQTEPAVAYPEGDVENPFRPTRNLLRSPVAKLDSRQFLAKFRSNNNDDKELHSETLLGASFNDEPTTYFNSDMEFTAVIDTTRLNDLSDRRSPFIGSMEEIPENSKQYIVGQTRNRNSNDKANMTDRADVVNVAPGKSKGDKNGLNGATSNKEITENKQSRDSTGSEKEKEKAMVEMRINKPGNFTFAASRKEADGSRKPVPEKVRSYARSKKKKVTPEKDREPKSDADKDVFNFGDRTPTVPLEKILQEKASSVYDLSMNESVAVPSMSLTSFREKNGSENILKETNEKGSESLYDNSDGQADCHIYHLPLKGSPEEKPKQKRGRSKSGTRSKSKARKPDDSGDEDYVPYKSRSRSTSRKADRNSDDEGYVPRSSRSKSSNRGRSRTRKIDSNSENKSARERISRSRTSETHDKHADKAETESDIHEAREQSSNHNYSESPVVVRRQTRSRSRRRPLVVSEDSVDSEAGTECSVSDTNTAADRKEKVELTDNSQSSHVESRKKRSIHIKAKLNDNPAKSNSKLLEHNEVVQNDSNDFEPTNRKSGSGSDHWQPNSRDETVFKQTNSGISENTDLSNKEKNVMKTTEPSVIYHLPLKGSPEESKGKRMTRSSSRTRHASGSDTEESDMRDRRSRSRSRKVDKSSEQHNSDKEEMNEQNKQNNYKPNSRSVKKSKVAAIEDSDSDFQTDTKHRRKSRRQTNSGKNSKNEIETDLVDEHNPKHKVAEKLDSIENNKETDKKSTVSTELFKDKNTDSDSSETASTAFQFVTKSRGRSLKLNTNNNEKQNFDDVFQNNNEKSEQANEKEMDEIKELNDRNENISHAKSEMDEINELNDRDENVSHAKSESIRNRETTEKSKHGETDNKKAKLKRKCNENYNEVDTEMPQIEEKVSKKENLSTKTPNLQVKDNKLKSVRKKATKENGTEKLTKSANKVSSPSTMIESETPKSRKSKDLIEETSRSKCVPAVNSNHDATGKPEGKRERLPTKTPSTVSSATTSSKSAKTKTSKSSRKKREPVKVDDDLTPKLKPSVKSNKTSQKKVAKENDEPNSRLANLKRRLTMLSSKMASLDQDDPSVTDSKKRSIDEHVGDDIIFEGDDAYQSKRARRGKPVSYVEVPLNKKLRQGDNMFEVKKSPISKAKAEKARIILGQRKTILNESITE